MALYTFPTTKTAQYYVQLAGDSYYSTRRSGPALGIVLHVTAGLQDLGMEGADNSAEGTAKWAVTREVSWHAGVDSDSIVPCLPSTYTGWHAKGYNSRTIGIEISNLDARWDNKPAAWVTATLRNAARAAAAYVKEYNLPLVLATRSQVDSAIAANRPFGFSYHSYLSDIRVDPGKTFPWARFIAMVKEELAGGTTTTSPTYGKYLTEDGVLDDGTRKAIQRWLRVTPDGSFGPITKKALQKRVGRSQTGVLTQGDYDAIARHVGATHLVGKPWNYGWTTRYTAHTLELERYINRAIRNGFVL